MSTLNEQLTELQIARDDIKIALEDKGQSVTKDIRTYAEAINQIASGGSTEGVKLFKTIDEMNDSEGNEIGDLAMVYGLSSIPMVVGETYTSLYFPKTITFNSAITATKSILLGSGSAMNVHTFRVTTSAIRACVPGGFIGTVVDSIKYTSSDGIVYVREDTLGDILSISEVFNNEYSEITVQEANFDLLSQMFFASDYIFNGVYSFSDLVAKKAIVPKLENTTFNSNNNTFDVVVGDNDTHVDVNALISVTNKIFDDNGVSGITGIHILEKEDGIYLGYATHKNSSGTIYYSSANSMGVTSAGEILDYIIADAWYAAGALEPTYHSYKVDFENLTYVAQPKIDGEFRVAGANYSGWFPVTGVKSIPLYLDIEDETLNLGDFEYENSEAVSTFSITLSGEDNLNYTYNYEEYVLLKTQLNATEDNVYSNTFYGKSGVSVGTLQNTNDLTFNQLQKRVKIYETLSNMSTTSTSLSELFKNYTGKYVPYIDTSTVVKMGSMFHSCTNLVEVPLLNTSNLESAGLMFYGCTSLVTIPELDTSKVTNFKNFVCACDKLEYIPQLNTSSALDMSGMFWKCSSLKSVPLLDTSNVTDMGYMFYDCTSLVEIPSFNTEKVTDMEYIFRNCTSLVTLPVLNVSLVTNMSLMVEGCPNLSDESLNNILTMCANATTIINSAHSKTLSILGLTEEQATKCTTLSNWSAASAAGWTTGY